MAENFLESPLQKKSPKEVGEQYFNDLLSWSFFQQSGYGNEMEKCFIMHDLLNDLAKYVCEDICIRLGVDEPKGIPKTIRHVSFSITRDECFDGFGSLNDTKKLHTFIPTDWKMNWFQPVPWSWSCKMLIEVLLSKFKLIRVLSLSHCKDLEEVPKSIGNLKHLRSLDLSDTDIEKLPDSIALLYKLQILKLNNCAYLKELPSCLHQLDNLRCLEYINSGVKNLPACLGKLKNLQVLMSSFCVDKSKEVSIQQLGELNLVGSLSIRELQNVENPSDALEADLKNKSHLAELGLHWNLIYSSSDDSIKAGDVIENLRPSKQLKKLSIWNYVGKQFPNWLLDNSLPNLVSLELRNCIRCQRFPPLGLLPLLKKLEISGFDEIVRIDGDFHGNNSCSFKSLETLEFSDMRAWEEWECQAVTGAFPRLRQFYIRNCPKLQLEALMASAVELRQQERGKLQLESGTMGGHNMEASLVGMIGHIILDTSLERLHIDCLQINSLLKSTSDDSVSLWTFSLDFFPTLKALYLSGFGNLEMISQCLICNRLEYLTITECPKLESLPGNMHMLLPSLRYLCIEDCLRLESFPDGGLPSNLEKLRLNNFSRVIGSLKRALGDSPSLQSLCIYELDAESFPDEGVLPLSLNSLSIYDSPNLQKLDYKGLYQLSSLEELVLCGCPNLERLPEEGLPKSISYFQIINCPLLEQRCQAGGEDWGKIAHIEFLDI